MYQGLILCTNRKSRRGTIPICSKETKQTKLIHQANGAAGTIQAQLCCHGRNLQTTPCWVISKYRVSTSGALNHRCKYSPFMEVFLIKSMTQFFFVGAFITTLNQMKLVIYRIYYSGVRSIHILWYFLYFVINQTKPLILHLAK